MNADSSHGIVTPEAVRLQFSEANVGSRGVAWLLDMFLLLLALAVVNTLLGLLLQTGQDAVPAWVAVTVLLIVNFLLFFGMPIGFETLLRGVTPGKSAMGLRVVTVEGAPVSFRHAAIRAALSLVDFWLTFGLAAVLSTMFSRRHQRLGDKVAGTVVLRERTAEARPWASQFTVPPGAESYAVTLDPAGLTPADYDLVRDFMLRAQRLAPQPRREIGQRLATTLARKIGHVPPATVSAELFLSCLIARYQQLHWSQAQWGAPATPVADPARPAPAEQPGERWGDFTPPT